MRSTLPTVALILGLVLVPTAAFAQTAGTTTPTLEVSGWIPYWRVSEGTRDARKHLSSIDILHPFAISVQPDGKLKDLAGLSKFDWRRLFREARDAEIQIIPTVMWSDTNAIHDILSDKDKRAAHIRRIVDLVKKGRYEGIDIDYEGKKAETKEAYAAFLGELKTALGDKILSCTIEARTPPESLYLPGKIPNPLQYANDYTAINTYCDRVNILAYDQQRADLKLNASRVGSPYYPVADLEWVRKVLALTVKEIDPAKIVLSVPTYGREVSVTVAPQWFKSYTQLWSVSDEYALDTADEYKVTPVRNAAGEKSFSYLPKDSPYKGKFGGNDVAASALAYANASGETVTINMVWWSDAEAIAQKIALAKEFGLRGIAIFKIDGAEDMGVWDLFTE